MLRFSATAVPHTPLSDADEHVIGGRADERTEPEHVVGEELVDPGPVEARIELVDALDRGLEQPLEGGAAERQVVQVLEEPLDGHHRLEYRHLISTPAVVFRSYEKTLEPWGRGVRYRHPGDRAPLARGSRCLSGASDPGRTSQDCAGGGARLSARSCLLNK